ncbi:hypothetical protein [Nocardioides sp. LML1-1-1.1]|uniref:hypothetical protein n=1 Tax=Nocardioides sp. LML1-1-1.1 TaxID=3135248 RepID=UPI0034376AF5
MNQVNTPGVGGYVVAWLVSVVVFVVALLLMIGESGWPPEDAGYLFVFVLLVSVPFAVPGILLVDRACRDIPSQLPHVLLAAGAGGLSGVVLFLLAPGLVLTPPVLAVATGLGRAAVVPLVWHRRNSAVPAVTG